MNCQRAARAAEEPGALASVHHDAVTGSTKTHTADWYHYRVGQQLRTLSDYYSLYPVASPSLFTTGPL